ncbi:MAG: hypothetical protein OEQ12_01370 [Nitrosopumilus sp.]|nr:hypothetical protein [Nitrosopumilus sp.]
MGSELIDVKESVEDTFSKIQRAIGKSDYKIKTVEANKSIIAEGNREFSWAILIWPAAIVYYFTRQRSSVTVITTPNVDSGCKVTINSNGKTGDQVMALIVEILQ